MKKINVRLTDEEHELLAGRAADARRSLQRQIVFELFHPSPEVRAVTTEAQLQASVERIATGRGLNYDQVREPRPVTDVKVDKNCRNADYHWKLQAGEECKFCGGTL